MEKENKINLFKNPAKKKKGQSSYTCKHTSHVGQFNIFHSSIIEIINKEIIKHIRKQGC